MKLIKIGVMVVNLLVLVFGWNFLLTQDVNITQMLLLIIIFTLIANFSVLFYDKG